MRILHVVTGVHKAGGGTSEVIPRMCEALATAGQDIRLVTSAGDVPSDAALRAKVNGVDVRFCPLRSFPLLSFPCVTKQYKKELFEGVVWADVVHVHGHWQEPGWLAIKFARRLGKPYVMQPHGFLAPERLKKSKWAKRIIGALIERPNLNRATAVIATAESEKRGIEQYSIRAPIKIVPLGLDTEALDAAARSPSLLLRLGLDLAKKTLLYFSRLVPIKGLDLLAEAWAQLPELHNAWQLLIAGPDDRGYATEIQGLYSRMITDGSVIFSGPLYGNEKNALLKSVDAFVLPTRSENWGIAVQEALAAGLPVVCTKGAPWKVIADEGAGEWVDVSVSAIREGLCNVLSADDASRQKMGTVGKLIVARNFGWEGIAKKLIDLYEAVRVSCAKD